VSLSSRIFRYRLPITDTPDVLLPAGAEVLSVGPPRDDSADLDLWALVDPAAPSRPRSFRIVGTGNPMPSDCGRFVGTVPVLGGKLIFHVFEAAP
jgi:hypothetical protein